MAVLGKNAVPQLIRLSLNMIYMLPSARTEIHLSSFSSVDINKVQFTTAMEKFLRIELKPFVRFLKISHSTSFMLKRIDL